ncbi:MAG: SDR family oxidoreductase [Clostridia bacterium]|nr:SDR family oxidoreductase [Clostridia bacterium]
MGRIEGKTAIVTGGAQGLGKEICLTLAGEGADVFILDLNEKKANIVADEIIGKKKKSKAYRVDITNSDGVNAAIHSIIQQEGKVDILVNNAGKASAHENILSVSDEIWAEEIAINLTGSFYCCRGVLRKMIEQKSGKIINISSIAADTGRPQTSPAYSAAKAGIYGLTMSMAKSVAKYGININAICPGVILTGIHDSYPKEALDELLSEIPYSRNGKPKDIANTVLFLASEASDYITGARIRVNGGSWMG